MKLKRTHVEEARSNRFLYPSDLVPTNPQQAVRDAMHVFTTFGIDVRQKHDYSLFPHASTAYHHTLRLSVGFDERPDMVKARTLWHELVHYRQRDAYGRHTFNARYLLRPRWRWVWEMQAYRMSLRVMRRLGYSSTALHDYVEHVVDAMCRKPYMLRILDHRGNSFSVLMQEADL